MSPKSIVHTQVETTLTGRQLTIARIAWIVFALTLTSLQVVSQIAAYQRMQSLPLPPDTIQGLEAMGLSPNFYQAFNYWLQWPEWPCSSFGGNPMIEAR